MRSPRVTCTAVAGTYPGHSELPEAANNWTHAQTTPYAINRGPIQPTATMISDGDLYTLAIFLGSASMVLIVVYHYFEVNAPEKIAQIEKPAKS
ncbi:unnamed protein product [Clonostachys rosea f. rosea IK726]|uniref:Uncharacterized protein n=1 Tax=Clonostachys rosea f. rosea IK726 TaxID=1349383 RepID=A0ACA9TTC5_BIOOC|nr:unnamed protein product [Clonostachys rosea f. rosea IK726]